MTLKIGRIKIYLVVTAFLLLTSCVLPRESHSELQLANTPALDGPWEIETLA